MKRWRMLLVAVVLASVGISLLALRLAGGGSSGPSSTLETDREKPPAESTAFGDETAAREPLSGQSLAPGASPEEVAPPLPQVAERKIVRQARLELAVEDVSRAVEEVENIAGEAGGFVASSNVYTEPEPRPLEESAGDGEPPERTQTATITVRVPANEYQTVISRLRGIATEVRGENSSTSDASEEFADLEARRRNLEATETTYLNLLSQATTIQDIILLQDRINAVRLEIERIQGRLTLLNDLSDLATIEVSLAPFLPAGGSDPQGWAEEAVEDAWDASQSVLQALGTAAIVGGIVLAWLAVPALAGLLAWRLLGSRRPRAGEN